MHLLDGVVIPPILDVFIFPAKTISVRFFVLTRGPGLDDFFAFWWGNALYDPILEGRRRVRAMSVAPPFASRYHHEKRASVRREASLVARSATWFEVVGQAWARRDVARSGAKKVRVTRTSGPGQK